MRSSGITWLILTLIVLFIAGLRARLLPIPLDRDEGEYAYMAQLILQGEVPYAQAYTMKYPGVTYAYAVILTLFGQTDVGIHLGLMVVNAASIVFVFLLGTRLFTSLVGLFAASAFGLLSLSRFVHGFSANTEHFVILPMLGATLLLLHALERQQLSLLFYSGLLFGLAVLMKQHAAAFLAFGVVYLFLQVRERDPRSWPATLLHLLVLSAGAALPLALLGLYLWGRGAFPEFWYWTFTYPRHYTSRMSFSSGLVNLTRTAFPLIASSAVLWALVLLGARAVVWGRAAGSHARFVALFTGFSLLSICPGLLFRHHYFLLLLPASSLLAGLGIVAVGQIFRRMLSPNRASAIVALFAALLSLIQQYAYFFSEPLEEIWSVKNSACPFNDMKELGLYLGANSMPDDRIAVLGSEPELYFYARRRAATRFIYTYPLMEPQPYALQMQKDMISEIERETPRFIAIVYFPSSWLRNPDSPHLIMDWSNEYVTAHYQRLCVAEVVSSGLAEYRWNGEASTFTPRGQLCVILYERFSAPDNADDG